MKTRFLLSLTIPVLMLIAPGGIFAQGTAFTYHGRLADGGGPATGSYDLTFSLFEAETGTNQVGTTITNAANPVSGGLFAATLDFGSGIFTGPERWLEISVRTNGAGGFTTLNPRQRLTPTPYAIMANTASNLLGTLPAGQLSGTLSDVLLPPNLARLDNDATFTGALTFDNPGNRFTGDGSGLASLNASQLTTGILADARLSANVALRDSHQVFSGSNTFAGVVQLTNTDNILRGTFTGNGSGLSLLNPANLAPGIAAIDISGNAATASSAPWVGITGIPAGFADGLDQDTLYSPGIGLNLNGTEFSVSFGGSGVAGSVARSDHDHGTLYASLTHNHDATYSLLGHAHAAADLTSGTLADERLSSNVALLNVHQTFSGSNLFSGVAQLTNTDNTFTGSGAGLSGLNPMNLAPGIAAIDISGNAATATSAVTATTATTASTATNFSGLLFGDVTGPQSATVVTNVGGLSAVQVASGAGAANAATPANTPDTLVRRDGAGSFAAGGITATNFTGSGSGLTEISASALASGTINDQRLSSNVALLNTHQTFSGSNLFSGVVQLTNTDNTFFGSFTGNGSGLTLLNPTNLSVGTAAIDISGNAATASTASAVPWSGITGTPPGFADGVDNDTLFSAGVGLNLNGTEFRVSFGGNGLADSVARSDHDHNGLYAALAHHHDGTYSLLGHTHAAADITIGTLADERLSSNVALLNAHQTFSGSNLFSGVVQLTNTDNMLRGTFTGNGSGLTLLNPTNLSVGTAAIDISGNAASASTASAVPWSGITGTPPGFADGADNDTLYLAGLGLNLNGTEFRVSFGGNGLADSVARSDHDHNSLYAALAHNHDATYSLLGHGHAATDLTSGTLADERLSINVALLNGHQTFSGSNLFVGINAFTNATNTFVGSFAGDGANLSNLVVGVANVAGLFPAERLIGTLPSGLLSGSYSNAVTFANPANSFIGSGAGLSGVNAATLQGLGAADFWQLGGNAATIAGVDFLGTTDDQPLELKVNNTRALRLEPNINGAPNIIGGAPVNVVADVVIGATISGGGSTSGMSSNSISSDFATIAGGTGNTIQTLDIASAQFASISGGQDNSINGALRSVIGGGGSNLIFSSQLSRTNINSDSTISGGWFNSIEAPYSTIGGGIYNQIRTNFPGRDVLVPITNGTIAGGISNTIWGNHSTIGGGRHNTIRVTGGFPPEYAPEYFTQGDCTIGGGSFNRLVDFPLSPLTGATIAGGSRNTIADLADHAFIGGGLSNFIGYYASHCVISGGSNNKIEQGPGVWANTIGGGNGNYIKGIGSTISGGRTNTMNAAYATIPGGENNATLGNYSFAAGRRAKAVKPGTFVWADSTDLDYDPYSYPVSGGNNDSFNVRASGGLYFVTAVDGTTGHPTSGMYVSAGGSGWNTYSDRNAKTNFAAVDGREILRRLEAIPILSWNYKTQDPSKRHIGPMAQDFNAAFEVGESDKAGEKKHIHSLDMDGVALAAIQGLNEAVKEKDAEIKKLKQSVAELKALVTGLIEKSNGGGQ